jgi:hypothetical protein
MKAIVNDIIGRNREIQELRVILEQTSVVMSSTRRMGKTMILTKIDEIHHPGTKTMLCFVESIQSAEEFVNFLREKLIELKLIDKNGFTRVFQWMNTNLGSKDVGIFRTPDFSKHWKIILNLMMDDLIEKHVGQVVLMLDEFPKMLWTMIQNGNHQQVEEILDELRHIRERHEKRSKLRFIYCGSVGMNLVISHLVKEFKYAGAPLNNMYHYIVEEMSLEDANQLISHLVEKHEIKLDEELVEYLAKACSCLPFFIDRIFMQLKLSFHKTSVTKTGIDKTVDEFISGRKNNNQFNHFTERIDAYYNREEKSIAHELLRILCKSTELMTSDNLINLVKSKIVAEDYEISKILSDLFEDMYVDRIIEGESVKYEFRFILLKKWWKLNFA